MDNKKRKETRNIYLWTIHKTTNGTNYCTSKPWAVDRLKSSKYLIAILEYLYISPEEFFKEIKELKIKW